MEMKERVSIVKASTNCGLCGFCKKGRLVLSNGVIRGETYCIASATVFQKRDGLFIHCNNVKCGMMSVPARELLVEAVDDWNFMLEVAGYDER